jgi:hypothetical protein
MVYQIKIHYDAKLTKLERKALEAFEDTFESAFKIPCRIVDSVEWYSPDEYSIALRTHKRKEDIFKIPKSDLDQLSDSFISEDLATYKISPGWSAVVKSRRKKNENGAEQDEMVE